MSSSSSLSPLQKPVFLSRIFLFCSPRTLQKAVNFADVCSVWKETLEFYSTEFFSSIFLSSMPTNKESTHLDHFHRAMWAKITWLVQAFLHTVVSRANNISQEELDSQNAGFLGSVRRLLFYHPRYFRSQLSNSGKGNFGDVHLSVVEHTVATLFLFDLPLLKFLIETLRQIDKKFFFDGSLNENSLVSFFLEGSAKYKQLLNRKTLGFDIETVFKNLDLYDAAAFKRNSYDGATAD
jgi:hypothetical protein